jgi:hypothetical protein
VDGGDYMRGTLHEILTAGDPRDGERLGLHMRWCTDSKDLFDTLHREGTVSTAEKRLALDVLVMKELLERERDHCHWVATLQMLADPLTKSMGADYLLLRLDDCRWSFTEDPALQKKPKGPMKSALSLSKLSDLAHATSQPNTKPVHRFQKERPV